MFLNVKHGIRFPRWWTHQRLQTQLNAQSPLQDRSPADSTAGPTSELPGAPTAQHLRASAAVTPHAVRSSPGGAGLTCVSEGSRDDRRRSPWRSRTVCRVLQTRRSRTAGLDHCLSNWVNFSNIGRHLHLNDWMVKKTLKLWWCHFVWLLLRATQNETTTTTTSSSGGWAFASNGDFLCSPSPTASIRRTTRRTELSLFMFGYQSSLRRLLTGCIYTACRTTRGRSHSHNNKDCMRQSEARRTSSLLDSLVGTLCRALEMWRFWTGHHKHRFYILKGSV